jgi:site-specific DNA-methyltransferase (adenine-specific)
MTEPYYQHGGVTIYLGDCREIVPQLELDSDECAALCDPPYGTGYYLADTDISAFIGGLLGALDGCCFGYPERLIQVVERAKRYPSEWVTWWPTNGACRGFNLAGVRNESEHIAFFGKHYLADLRESRSEESRRIVAKNYNHADGGAGRGLDTHGDPESRRLGDVWRFPSPGLGFLHKERQHPNEKPEALMLRLVEAVSEPGKTILDPTCGSGVSLWAARQLGRKAIGIDIDEKCCELSAKRLAQEVLIA